MQKKLLFCLFICLFLGLSAQPALMPMPQKVHFAKGKMRFSADLRIAIQGKSEERLYRAADRLLRRLDARTGQFFKQHSVGAADTSSQAEILFVIQRPAELKLHENEEYRLEVTEKQVIIEATTDLGGLRAIETLLQLLSADKDGFYFPVVQITDFPRFAWRGLLIDVCRHWLDMETIKRNLDCMAAAKLNVLHLHLSEDQSFRMESKQFPKLQQLASDGNYFTQDQLRELVQYAADRGIRIMPEFDIPGHATAILTAYPELGSLDGKTYELARGWGVFEGLLDPTRQEVYDFLDKFFDEVVSIFPDAYLHIGGDEVNPEEWKKSERVKAFMKQENLQNMAEVQTYFNARIYKILKAKNRNMMGWDEIFHAGIPKEIAIQSWRGKSALYKAAREGHKGILSNGYYIDLIESAEKHYLNDPLPADVDLKPEEIANVLGGEATMWSEHVTMETVDSRIWTRTAAIAERFWSAREVNEVRDMYRRLETMSLHLEWAGSRHLTNKAMLIRRLANGNDPKPLENLLEVIEPLKGYERNKLGNYGTFSPYTLLADAAIPDAKGAREFRWAVDDYLKTRSKDTEAYLRKQLRLWKDNHYAFEQLSRNAPALKEALELSRQLSVIAQSGLEALDIMSTNKTTPDDWRSLQMQRLKAARAENGGRCELMVVDAVEKLVKGGSW